MTTHRPTRVSHVTAAMEAAAKRLALAESLRQDVAAAAVAAQAKSTTPDTPTQGAANDR